MKKYCSLFVAFALLAIIANLSCKKDKILPPAAEDVRLSIDSIGAFDFYHLRIFVSWKMPEGYQLVGDSTIINKASEHGICYNYTGNPTINDTKTQSYTNDPKTSIDGLFVKSYLTIYFRAYVIINGTVYYSPQKSTTTSGLKDQWEKEFISGDFFSIRSVVYDDNNGFAILGSVHGADSPDNCWSRLIKVDGNGNMLWSKDYRESVYYMPYRLLKINDGYVIISGSKNPDTGNTLVAKTTSEGSQVDRFVLGPPVSTLIGIHENAIRQLVLNMRDNSISFDLWTNLIDWPNKSISLMNPRKSQYNISSGLKKSISTPDGWTVISDVHGEDAVSIASYSLDNHYKWHVKQENYYYPGTGNIEGISIRQNVQKNPVVLTCVTYYPKSSIGTLTELDANTGKQLWHQFIRPPNFIGVRDSRTMPTDFSQDRDGNYYVTGTVQTLDSTRAWRFIMKHGTQGAYNWHYRIPESDSISKKDVHSIFVTPEKTIYLFGARKTDGLTEANTQLYIFKGRE
ncbi:hypothetical protein HHL17_28505 [Chitinophaga sp. G-6-1-13]|uniref:Uncharacterized protein n=1 Tax=Chitinophaga fulva TaxID=2728842 RepID=A0A848GV08_9BACT|nr:hypothetical protein [Chitinophaga fulva]NML41169.1 hypothetical protein [Chitinophaga fulva]